jgi:hypothetical protein
VLLLLLLTSRTDGRRDDGEGDAKPVQIPKQNGRRSARTLSDSEARACVFSHPSLVFVFHDA